MKHNPIEQTLERLGLSHWQSPLTDLIEARLTPAGHGDLPRWLRAIESLPNGHNVSIDLDCAAVAAQFETDQNALQAVLAELKPWRKGPFLIGGIEIDTEWRSDMKWARLADRITPLRGRRVLDVGAGNGYFGFRMLGAGADAVLGIDPTLLFVAQFSALSKYLATDRHALLPLRLEELPPGEQCFDTVFSMGVLYHQRSPIDHLKCLRQHCMQTGELVLETLVLPGDTAYSRTPEDRYARMRNVWMLPSVPELKVWLSRSGFSEIAVLDVTATTVEEQRPTAWMEFESLEHALDPDNPSLTVEGWPAPLRATLLAR